MYMQNKKITGVLIVLLIIIIGAGYALTSGKMNPLSKDTSPDLQTNNSEEMLTQRAKEIALLTESPISKSVGSIFNFLNSTTSKVRSEILARPPFTKEATEKLTTTKLQSKYIVIGGREIPGVGAEIFLTFPGEPDTVFRAAFQNTYSEETPFTLVNFDVTTEKAEEIVKFLNEVAPALEEALKEAANAAATK